MQFLAAEARALVTLDNPRDEGGREVGPVVVGRAPGDHAVRIPDQRLDQGQRLGCGGDRRSWILAEAKTQLQLVPHRLGPAPGGQFVRPGRIVLRPTQAFRLLSRIAIGRRAVRPDQPPLGRLEGGPLPGRADVHQARLTLDHHIAHIRRRGAHEGDPPTARSHLRPHPLGPGPGLAEAAAGQDQPIAPVARRRQLRRPTPYRPAVVQQHRSLVIEIFKLLGHPLTLLRRQRWQRVYRAGVVRLR